MAEKILGPHGSKRRKRFLWVPMLLIACTALFVIGSAQAVYNTGLFQLDGNGDLSHNWGPGGTEDWINICAQYQASGTNVGSDVCHPSSNFTLPTGPNFTSADKSTFVTDAFNAGTDNIFKGGTDDGSITTPDGVGGALWQWKQATPSPNKADIEQAFAAQYTCTAACGNNYFNSTTGKGDKIVYFGGTRYANDGDTNIGIWLFHNKVTLEGTGSTGTGNSVACPDSNGCGFSGTHTPGNISLGGTTPGDIFIQSAFTSAPSISVFEWVGPGKATAPCITNACDLQPVPLLTGTSNKCPDTNIGPLASCALVNDLTTICTHATTPAQLNCTGKKASGAILSPWHFQDSSPQSAADVIQDSELFEGGIDLTKAGFGGACTSTFLLNTRSSGSSVNSTAQDFALGQLGSCNTTLSTAVGTGTGAGGNGGAAPAANIGGGNVSSGADVATLTVQGVDTWGGTLSWYLCGPLASIPLAKGTGCNDGGSTPANGGVLVTSRTVSNSSPATDFVSGSATLTSAGNYCWFSRFTPNSDTAKAGVNGATDDGTGDGTGTSNPECFNIAKVTPSLDTTAIYPNPGTPPPAFVAIGNSGFQTPFGSPVYDKGSLSGAATEPGTDGGKYTDPSDSTKTIQTNYKSINAVVANLAYAGNIGFVLYGPDSGGASKANPNCTDQASAYTDPANSANNETQTFALPNGVSPAPAHGVAVTGNVTYGADGSIHWKPGSPGTYHWVATYTDSGSANNDDKGGIAHGCPSPGGVLTPDPNEQVIVQQISTTTKTVQSWVPNDTATVAASASGGNTLQGKITFTLYPNADCNATESDTALYTKTFGTDAAPLVADSTTHKIVQSTDNTTAIHKLDGATGGYPNVSWKVTFTPVGDPSHTGSNNSCDEKTVLSITDSP